MVIVDEVLIVCIGVDRLNMTTIDPKFIIDDFQHRRDRIRCAGSRGKNFVFRLHFVIIDTVDDIFQRPFAGSCKQHLIGAFGFEMQPKTLFITPFAGVVDN